MSDKWDYRLIQDERAYAVEQDNQSSQGTWVAESPAAEPVEKDGE